MIKPTTGTSKTRSYQTNALIAWNSVLSLEAWYVLQWLKVWWAWRHAIITCPMLQMPYPSLLRQHQSQANAGKSKCEGGGICYFEHFIFFYIWLKSTQTALHFHSCLGAGHVIKTPWCFLSPSGINRSSQVIERRNSILGKQEPETMHKDGALSKWLIWDRYKLFWIRHFRITLCLCFKTSLRGKPSCIMKVSLICIKWTYRWKSFSYGWFSP